MEYAPRHVRTFRPRYYELDSRGELTPSAMMSLFEEAAFSHLESTGWDVYRLLEAGYGWILLQGSFTMDRYPRYREDFSIETWVPGQRLFYGLRKFEVKDSEGRIIGTAHSFWVFYNLAKERPAPPLQEILDVWKPDPQVVLRRDPLGGNPPEVYPDAPETQGAPFDVRTLDIDTNGHVNHVRYIDWAMEAVPTELRQNYQLRTIEGRYIHEIVLGQEIIPYAVPRSPIENTHGAVTLQMAVYAKLPNTTPGSAVIAASAQSTWIPRDRTE